MRQIVPHLWEIEEIGSTVHCYMWEWQGKISLIDCGMPKDGKTILSALVDHGNPVHSVDRILITHVDMDHTGGLPTVKKATGASVVCHAVEKQAMEHPNRRKITSVAISATMSMIGIFPPFRQKPSMPDVLVIDEQELPEGFTVIHTPGHTPGHISLLHRKSRLLIAGDALNNRGGKLQEPPAIFTPDRDAARRSILKLAKKYGDDFETVVFGHGPPILTNGGKRLRAFASQLFADEV